MPERSTFWWTRKTRLDWAVAGLTVTLYLVAQLKLLQGPHPYDPSWYFNAAVVFPDAPVDLFTLRIGLIVPVHVGVLLFGPSEAALYAVPLVSGVILVGAVYGSMLVLFEDRVLAGAAALVTGLNVSYLVNSSQIFPDTTATATFTAAFFFLLVGGKRTEDVENRWLPILAALVGGLLLGWTYLIREFSPVVLLPTVVALVVLLRYPLRRIALLAGAALAAVSLELVYGLLARDDAFVHARLLFGRGDVELTDGERRVAHIQSQLENPWDTLLVFPRLLLAWDTGWTVLLLAGLLAVSLVLVRHRGLWLLGVWFSSFALVMAIIGLGSLSSGGWILNITNIRYWYPALPPLVMGAFGGFWLLLRGRFGARGRLLLARLAAAAIAAAVLVPGLREFRSCSEREAWRNDPDPRWHELRSWFSTPTVGRFDTVWSDRFTSRLLPVYTASTFGRRLWRGDFETLELPGPVPPAADPAGTLIVLHKDRSHAWGQETDWIESLRADDWTPLFVSGDQRMVVLAHESAAAGSGTPDDGEWWSLTTNVVAPAPGGTCGRNPYDLDA